MNKPSGESPWKAPLSKKQLTPEWLGAVVIPPSTATPPGINLMSGVGAPITGVVGYNTHQISVAADGTLWISSQGNEITLGVLLTYNFATAEQQQVYSSQSSIAWVSAVSADAVYIIVNDATPWIGKVDAQGNVTKPGALPNGATPVQVSGAVDGTLWALDSNGLTYLYNAVSSAFIAVQAQGLVFSSISAGSATNIVGLASQGGQPATAWSWTTTQGWQPLAAAAQMSMQWIAACADGALWLLSGNLLTVITADGFIKPMDVSSISFPMSWTAASKMSAYVGGIVDAEIVMIPVALGILDLPPTPWPPMTAGQQAAYNALSSALGVTNPAGVRSQYTNAAEPFSIWYTEVATMPVPNGISPADWSVVQAQIKTELVYVQSVFNIFSELTTLTGLLSTMQSDQLQGVAAAAGLTMQQQGQSEVSVILNSLAMTLLTRVGSLIPPPYGLAVSLVGAGLAAAATYTQQQYSPNSPSGTLAVAYSQLATAMATEIAQTVTEQGNEQTAVLTDWGKLSAAGQAIAQGIWSWPVNLTGQMLVGLEPVWQLYFYQALMPAAWQILEGIVIYMPTPPPVKPPNAPAHAMMVKLVTDNNLDELVWYYICCQLGSNSDIIQNDGPYPSSTLTQNIFSLNVNPSDFFGGQNGWSLPVVQSSGWSDPPANIPWEPYNPND